MSNLKFIPVNYQTHAPARAFRRPGYIDLQRYCGKWYVIAAVPTKFDKDWYDTTETYFLRKDGNIDVLTKYYKNGEKKELYSKGIPQEHTANVSWKVLFFWVFRSDYLIEEIADDYSWVVVGHPKKKFLYIMARQPHLDVTLLSAIRDRCRRSGYDVTRLIYPNIDNLYFDRPDY